MQTASLSAAVRGLQSHRFFASGTVLPDPVPRLRVTDQRGNLLQWSDAAGRIIGTAHWPSSINADDPTLHMAAMSAVGAWMRASEELDDARENVHPSKQQKRAAETVARHMPGAFQHFRTVAIAQRDAHRVALAGLDAPITKGGDVEALLQIEIRDAVHAIGTTANAFEFVMKSTGIETLNAVVPFIDRTRFVHHPEMVAALREEFRIRKLMTQTTNERDDKYSSAERPTQVTRPDDELRKLAREQVELIERRGEAVELAEKLLGAMIDYAHAVAALGSRDEAFALLQGRKAAQ